MADSDTPTAMAASLMDLPATSWASTSLCFGLKVALAMWRFLSFPAISRRADDRLIARHERGLTLAVFLLASVSLSGDVSPPRLHTIQSAAVVRQSSFWRYAANTAKSSFRFHRVLVFSEGAH